jgi:hypothetical protein
MLSAEKCGLEKGKKENGTFLKKKKKKCFSKSKQKYSEMIPQSIPVAKEPMTPYLMGPFDLIFFLLSPHNFFHEGFLQTAVESKCVDRLFE